MTTDDLHRQWLSAVERCHALGLAMIAVSALGSNEDRRLAKAFYDDAQTEKNRALNRYRLARLREAFGAGECPGIGCDAPPPQVDLVSWPGLHGANEEPTPARAAAEDPR